MIFSSCMKNGHVKHTLVQKVRSGWSLPQVFLCFINCPFEIVLIIEKPFRVDKPEESHMNVSSPVPLEGSSAPSIAGSATANNAANHFADGKRNRSHTFTTTADGSQGKRS